MYIIWGRPFTIPSYWQVIWATNHWDINMFLLRKKKQNWDADSQTGGMNWSADSQNGPPLGPRSQTSNCWGRLSKPLFLSPTLPAVLYRLHHVSIQLKKSWFSRERLEKPPSRFQDTYISSLHKKIKPSVHTQATKYFMCTWENTVEVYYFQQLINHHLFGEGLLLEPEKKIQTSMTVVSCL